MCREFESLRGHQHLVFLEEGAAFADAIGDRTQNLNYQFGLADLAWRRENLDEAERRAQGLRQAADVLRAPASAAQVLVLLSMVAERRGRLEAADGLMAEAAERYRTLGDTRREASALGYQARFASLQKRESTPRRFCRTPSRWRAAVRPRPSWATCSWLTGRCSTVSEGAKKHCRCSVRPSAFSPPRVVRIKLPRPGASPAQGRVLTDYRTNLCQAIHEQSAKRAQGVTSVGRTKATSGGGLRNFPRAIYLRMSMSRWSATIPQGGHIPSRAPSASWRHGPSARGMCASGTRGWPT